MDKWNVASGRVLFGLSISYISVLFGMVLAIYFTLSEEAIPYALLAWPATSFLLGLCLAFTDVAEHLEIGDEIRDWKTLLEDDLDSIKIGKITRSHVYTVLTLVAVVAVAGLIFKFQKWNASWGAINVLTVSLVVSLVVFFGSLKTDWFQNRYTRFPVWIYGILALGLIFSVGLGVYFAEPREYGGMTRLEQSELARSEDYWSQTRSGSSRIFYFLDISSSEGSDRTNTDFNFNCDGDECAYALLFVLLMIIVAICVIGSAMVPHFWVVASTLLLTLLIVTTLRELLYFDQERFRQRYY